MSDKVISFGDYILRESDLALLRGEEWLNDTLIGFYFEYLSITSANTQEQPSGDNNPARKVCYFVGPEVTQLLKLIAPEDVPTVLHEVLEGISVHEYTLFAVNDSNSPEKQSAGSHWSLLVYSKVEKRFVHFDTMDKSNDKDAKLIVTKLSIPTANAQFVNNRSCKKQANFFDCGCHVLKNADLIKEYVTSHPGISLLSTSCPSATPEEANQMRPQFLALVHNLVLKQNQGDS